MIEQFVSLDFIAALSMKLDFLTHAIDHYLSGANNLKIVSLILMILALILFLFLIIIIYVRNIIYFVKSNNPAKNMDESEPEESAEEDEAAERFEIEEEERQRELEKELQRELELALAERMAAEQKNLEEQRKEQQKIQKAEQKKNKKEKATELAAEEAVKTAERVKGAAIDLDWQKGKIPPAELIAGENAEVSLSYKQSRKELNQLMGLVIDMLGRGVDDLKIAQTLNFKNQGMTDENDILKAIDAVKEFIGLCISGKFAKLPESENLPGEDEALFHLANGDTSLALALLESLMDTNIDKANAGNSEEKRQRIYAEVSKYACCFGALAEMDDIMLATSAYELAIELQSVNVTAWGRLGDVYKAANSMPKAVWAYQNVLNFADGEIDIMQVANANRSLSEHLYAEGNSLQAAKLYNSSKQYYDSLGINRRLDKQEIEIIEIIESNQQTSLPEMIQKLLGSSNSRAAG